MVERRLFEDLVDSDVKKHTTGQSYTLPVSIAIHVVVLIAVVVVPLLTSAELPEPAAAVKAFFVDPQAAPPPPPPPPPPGAIPLPAGVWAGFAMFTVAGAARKRILRRAL